MKFLIVDNNAAVRRLIASVVASIASEIVECSDGSDALVAYTTHRPDVVLMDIEMPQVDGIAATGAIIGADPAARVIIVSDYGEPELRDAAIRAGACDYLVKENLSELLHLLVKPGC
jgi:two-component system response regulator DegU